MKRLLVLTFALPLLALLSAPVFSRPGDKLINRPYADMKRWNLGFSVGMHVQDLEFRHHGIVADNGSQWRADVPSFSPGFCVGVMGQLRLHRYLSLRFSPGMYFGSKGITVVDAGTAEPESGILMTQDVKSAYVVLPLDFKIAGDRMGNTRPYVTVGTMPAFDVGKKRSETLMFDSTDLYFTVGMGLDLYLPFFKLDPEIKFCFGMTDILRHNRPDLADDITGTAVNAALKKVKSNMVVLTFYFE